ncbi:uncharacterized protein LOC143357643 [Halictus rubicundus]|uniref:uncharacterized protein LOC143357643 n=1 Tax=Halictus rubicundus TaxID=77578 RepID=UPI0040364039
MSSCPPMPPPPCPPDCPPPPKDAGSKYFREIGTAMVGNQLIIRMEREKGRSRKLGDWIPPCDCDVVEIQRPTSKEGPKILKGPTNNQILFRINSKSQLGKKENASCKPQGIYYEVGQCKEGRNRDDKCRTFTIYPVMDGPCSQEVHTDRVTEGNENVFMLRVKKKPGPVEEPKKHIELELRTPQPPPPLPEPRPEPPKTSQRRCEEKKISKDEPKKKKCKKKTRK